MVTDEKLWNFLQWGSALMLEPAAIIIVFGVVRAFHKVKHQRRQELDLIFEKCITDPATAHARSLVLREWLSVLRAVAAENDRQVSSHSGELIKKARARREE